MAEENEKVMNVPTREEINIIHGKTIAGTIDLSDVEKLLFYINYLETELDRCDEDDLLGTEGWRHYFGVED